jgi:very-short-patch-repair endonuclease
MKKETVTQERALSLRKHQTEPERIIWQLLRRKTIGYKFKRQQPIDHYITDFICFDRRLIVEVDGGQHTLKKDQIRTAYLNDQGFHILRFWNNDVINNKEAVYRMIVETLSCPLAGKGQKR